ncbi:5-methyltetrahydropteroyltriglutamate--homocysteine S-methyltransferase [Blochmannia endosymbiont of Polyrhachis (Hedomyrma) turneri]|uniref:5-methyltetrahydropteroyltriglutamate-- homocysteine S-methyltransferase n=1 Tax=Blochmannia endosymbiont of Polyrhachis (Hedomyrma) turneri TaxID=1505596 RepID=UPI00061A8A4C|nr:5-methyltetrahydropteroyltriglutamate--homocysteine S-methyltransferase [Blochmannia endosymbiont of Polyrhachis (Hedomyrma) turneri]AKC60180.1 5-methyltetrahydropteroyltriglutamate--homocysteine methyltransferase [Blochmannia endosymbiont of Polyrhachis (Hedomyrma) turneri]
MLVLSHILGFPRIGLRRELKQALEKYWSRKINKSELFSVGRELRIRHWRQQRDSGIDFVSVGDFAWYDHVLNTSLMLDNIPDRFRVNHSGHERKRNSSNCVDVDTLFHVARGATVNISEKSIIASEMKKWFNTNYHYIVPEFIYGQTFRLAWMQLFDEVDEALSLGHKVKVILLGPMSYLWLGKMRNNTSHNTSHSRLSLLPELLLIYRQILKMLSEKGVIWVQIDEPILVLELSERWCEAFFDAYRAMHGFTKLLLTTYFGSIHHHMNFISNLLVDGLHVDLVSGNDDLNVLHAGLPEDWVLSVGVINGRNIWRANLSFWCNRLFPFLGKRVIWVGSSCSLLHVPVDLDAEILLDSSLKKKFAFAIQKCNELRGLCNILNNAVVSNDLCTDNIVSENRLNINLATAVKKEHKKHVDEQINSDYLSRSNYTYRMQCQRSRFNLPLCPVTTIGSFPQTAKIRSARLNFRIGNLDQESYDIIMKQYIKDIILAQEELGLDVFVHGEPERNDMVEYFGEHLNGFLLTHNGWIQSYGSRCVKPPIIFDDVTRSGPITVKWITYAQSLTNKPVKGILTGPVTILCWSFPREDVTQEVLVSQIASAIRDEVCDLEKCGIGIIQIDEPALREGLPLKKSCWKNYLAWAVRSFKFITSVVSDDVQVHTHMCYAEFDDIIDSIVAMDVDVLSIESSRMSVKSLEILKKYRYNAIGPGVYDIHSPNVPSKEVILNRLEELIEYIEITRLWVNPDCGLKTRSWIEIKQSLFNIVGAVREFRVKNQ